jgi:LacI family transcriptional regulator
MEIKKATITDVANHSKVSIKTVSRVINNEYGVSKITKSRVLNSIKLLNYNPNKAAQGLRSKKSFLIGLAYDNPDKFYLSDIQTGVLEACVENGFSVVLFPCNYSDIDLYLQLSEFVKRTNLDGLILTPPISDMKELVQKLKIEIPLSIISPGQSSTDQLWVSSDDFKASYDMTCHLINQGHKKIGFIKGHVDHGATEHRLNGYLNALKDNNINVDKNNITDGDFSFDSGESAAKKLLSNKKSRITAIFASNDAMAAGVLKAAYKAKIKIPDDISLVGFDNSPTASQAWPSITTVSQPIKEMASFAAEILIQHISKKLENKSSNKIFDSELIFRESVKRI